MSAKLESAIEDYSKLQKDYSIVISQRTLLESQLKENESVQKEFSLLKQEANIYKLLGPVLLPQEKSEAVGNVKKRIEFIKSEIKSREASIKTLSSKLETAKNEIVALQTVQTQS
jgi:prefoldin beta subunit